MNILIIINSFRLGGAEKLCYDLARKLSQKANMNIFLYSVGKIESDLEKKISQSFNNSSIVVGSFDKPYKKRRLKTALKIKNFCELNKIDIIHTNGQSPDFLARCSKTVGNKSKIVVTIHSTSGYSKIQEKIFAKYTDAYIAVSRDALLYSRKKLDITKDIELIDNGIDLQTYSDVIKNNTTFELLSVGRVQPEKDYIKAAQFLEPFLKRHKEVKWFIFGDCSSNKMYFQEVQQMCAKLGILDSIVFKGTVTNPKEIYRHGKVFILASSFEGFGIAFIEAIMSNHYIFSRDVGVIQDILRYGGISHEIDNKESLEILESIYSNTYQSAELERNKEIVRNLYSLDKMVEKYYAVYERILSNERKTTNNIYTCI